MFQKAKSMKMKKIEIIKQFLYNAMATTLPTMVLQLVVLPLIALKMDGNDYGLLLTIVAAVMMVAGGIGNVVNNVHMLMNNQYEEERVSGDYGIVFVLCTFVLSAFAVGISYVFNVVNISEQILIVVLTITMFAKEYYIVRFWIDLDYFGVLKCNVICVIGYIIGLASYWAGGNWQYIYILGNSLSFMYIIKMYGIPIDFFSKTLLFGQTVKRIVALTISTILTRSLQYVDRLLLYPLLGGEEVTIYYVSTLIGKTIAIALGPINSFLLSQLAKKEKIEKKSFGQILLVTFGIGIIAYLFCLVLARPILKILYAQWVGKSMRYVAVTTLTAVVSAMSLVISPIVLRFCNTNWQMVISGVCFCVYVTVSLVLLKIYGLMGFCVGGLVANIVSLFLMILIYLISYQNKERK